MLDFGQKVHMISFDISTLTAKLRPAHEKRGAAVAHTGRFCV